eukprot:3228936-Pyramimonas_sp.AAC.2
MVRTRSVVSDPTACTRSRDRFDGGLDSLRGPIQRFRLALRTGPMALRVVTDPTCFAPAPRTDWRVHVRPGA